MFRRWCLININSKSLRERIKSGEIVFGIFYKTDSPIITEILGYSGFDFIIVDQEHSTIGYQQTENMVRTAENAGISIIVRTPNSSEEHIQHALDSGADGIQIPNICSIEQAKRVVSAAKYFPEGIRGLSPNTRAAKYGMWDKEKCGSYIQYANNHSLTILHIENKEMAENIEELCNIEGVDVFFVGATDLSQSFGKPGENNSKEVERAIQHVFDVCKKHNKAYGAVATSEEKIDNFISMGAQYIIYGSDTALYAKAANAAVRIFEKYR